MTRRPGSAAVAGGLTWAILPLVYGLAGTGAAAVVAVAASSLLLVSLWELRERHPAAWDRGTHGQTGTLVAGGGLGLVLVGGLLRSLALVGPGVLAASGVGVAVVGAVIASLGSAVLGYALLEAGALPPSVGLGLGLALPASVVVNAVLVSLAGVGIGLYGVAWMLVGLDARADRRPSTGATAGEARSRSGGRAD